MGSFRKSWMTSNLNVTILTRILMKKSNYDETRALDEDLEMLDPEMRSEIEDYCNTDAGKTDEELCNRLSNRAAKNKPKKKTKAKAPKKKPMKDKKKPKKKKPKNVKKPKKKKPKKKPFTDAPKRSQRRKLVIAFK